MILGLGLSGRNTSHVKSLIMIGDITFLNTRLNECLVKATTATTKS
jgi:hypothetical protein